MSFCRESKVRGRKPHRCDQCAKLIAAGEEHVGGAHNLDGDFVSFREHVECRQAWLGWRKYMRTDEVFETSPFLIDDDLEREWFETRHPIVARRLWPQEAKS